MNDVEFERKVNNYVESIQKPEQKNVNKKIDIKKVTIISVGVVLVTGVVIAVAIVNKNKNKL